MSKNFLSPAQEEYFKDSKIRDKENNLQVFYHATNARFDAFDKKFIGDSHGSSFGEGFYFSSETLPAYGDNIAVYLDVHNPYVLDLQNTENLKDFAKKIEVDYEELQSYITWACSVKHGISKTLKENNDLDPLKDKGYDGLIILNTSVGMYNQPKQAIEKEVVVFEPNQIKSIYNLYPTKSNNFKDNKEEYLEMHKESNLSPAQDEYFKDSKVRDKNGNLQLVYHGSHTGVEFNSFGEINTPPGYWFSEDIHYASDFGDNLIKVYLNMKNPLDMTTSEGDDLLWKYMHECFGEENLKNGYSEKDTIFSYKFRDFLIEKGYDGMIWDHSEANTYVAFYPEQIKSINNLYPTKSPVFTDNKEEYFKAHRKICPPEKINEEINKLKASNKTIKKNKDLSR